MQDASKQIFTLINQARNCWRQYLHHVLFKRKNENGRDRTNAKSSKSRTKWGFTPCNIIALTNKKLPD